MNAPLTEDSKLCGDCPPWGYPTNKTRCKDCPRVRGVSAVKILGTEFEAGADGWCRHCGWARLGHVIGATTGKFLCKADVKDAL